MTEIAKPTNKPIRPYFSSGPCCKRPGWTTAALSGALTGRSHRSIEGRARLKRAIDETRDLLHVPPGYEIAILPGSDTGAFEIALWNLLGPRGVDVFAWDVFGRIWLTDVLDHLPLDDVRKSEAAPGHLPDLSEADFSRDVIFTWNGTTTGVRVPDASWIAEDREGLTFCDATSAIFAEDIDLTRIDCLTFSWQKVLGGEAAHGMLVLSPRALQRLREHTPRWPVAKLMRLKSGSEVFPGLFEGVTINTPSMLCVEDYLDALAWAHSLGGAAALRKRAQTNARIVYDWLAASRWAEPLAAEPATRSNTSVCLKFSGAAANDEALGQRIVRLLADEGVAFDIAAYRGMPPGLRIWTGATVEAEDLSLLLPWLDWAYASSVAQLPVSV